MRSIAFDYTLFGADDITDLRVEADVELPDRVATITSVTVLATGEPFDIADLRSDLEIEAVEHAVNEWEQEIWERRAS